LGYCILLMRRAQGSGWLLLAGLLGVAACAARQPGDPLRPGFNLYSVGDDIEIGRQVASSAEEDLDIVADPVLQTYVSDLGRRLASDARTGPYPYSFKVIRDPSINAFALPGGPVYIHTGLIEAAANESQLAGVIAHEISHVALRHGTNQASRASLLQIPAMLASGALGDQSAGAQLGQLGLSVGLSSVLLSYSRTAESEADALGARIMSETGYDPIEMAAFFETLQAAGGARGPEFLSSHPNPGNRTEAVRAEIRTFPSAGPYNASTGRFPGIRARVIQMRQAGQ
jgi:predicted Zn-dependent protease